MKIKFNFKNNEFFIEAEECRSFWRKTRGLMFRREKNLKPLLFIFNKPVKSRIHSFFVSQKFLAIWMKNNEIIGAKVVKPWSLFVMPAKKFDKLLEIPFKSSKWISKFLVGSNKHLNSPEFIY